MKIIIIITVLLLIIVLLLLKSKFGEIFPENDEDNNENEYENNNQNNNQNNNILSDSDSDSESNNTIYIFYAPWCGYCKRSMSVFEKLADNFSNVKLIDTDESKNKSLMNKYSVKSFPTIIASNGKKYSGERTFDSMSDFVNQNK